MQVSNNEQSVLAPSLCQSVLAPSLCQSVLAPSLCHLLDVFLFLSNSAQIDDQQHHCGAGFCKMVQWKVCDDSMVSVSMLVL